MTEKRTVSLNDWPAPHDPSSNFFNCPRWTDVNAWQDRGTRGRLFSESAAWTDWRGAMWQYGQLASIAPSNTAFWFLRNPYYELKSDDVHVYGAGTDKDLDTKDRIVLVHCWAENTAAELPKGASYDPDTFALTPTWHLWYTGDGATDTNPPVGHYWTPWPNTYMFALDDGTCMCFRNETAGELDLCMTMWVFEKTTATEGYREKRVWNQNRYRTPRATHFNTLQDRYVQLDELNQSTLLPTNVIEGGSLHFGQFTYATGANPLTAIDTVRDWRSRMMLSHWVRFGNAAELPGGAAYAPDTFATAARKLWYTQAGADPAIPFGGPPADFCWTPEANLYLFAARLAVPPLAVGDLGVRNNTGGLTYGMILNLATPDCS
jgi:hypothetical protein